ncbi:uncharacterized protein EI97DRAFT_435256 [Westerdykella ornata]|uniref:Uncharacterized protein n=1 Tax=Westerdykella ornata TaxID=318751 RepID=A0A6A6JCY4_WESOR|nr:uncharacterized protein EI97DRAFT_435256 [Westerdykella ornata]KAF2274421.1 hypothetical protein EI97DRAFT_435256 [Westerdykella ornata]
MSAEYKNTDPIKLAKQAERDLNSQQAKGEQRGMSDSTTESGVDASATRKFPGADVTYGSAASGTGDNREIPESEGGGVDARGRPYKAGDFEGLGGPEDKVKAYAAQQPGDDDVRSNVKR